MRKVLRHLVVSLPLLATLTCLGGGSPLPAETAQQSNSGKGTILVKGGDAQGLPPGVQVVVRVNSLTESLNLTSTIESTSTASFEEISAGQYLIQVAALGYQPAEMNVAVVEEETTQVSIELASGSTPSLALRLRAPVIAEASGTAETPPEREVTAANDASASSCPLPEVMRQTAKRLEEFVKNVNRINAVEALEHQRLDKRGKVLESEHHRYDYVAIIEEPSPGVLNVSEYRDGSGGIAGFPHDVATVGMPFLAMVFHPYHQAEFEMTCVGRVSWRDRPAWLVTFQQRKDKPARISHLRAGLKLFPLLLKGAAWVDVQNFQIIHLETDLLEPLPQAKLYVEHQELDYGPVQFNANKISLWLPQEAEIYLDSGGRHFRHRHSYSKYQLFSVDVEQKIGLPE